MTQILEDMLLVTTQVWSSTILVILEGEKEGKGRRRGGWEREGEARVWSEAARLQ